MTYPLFHKKHDAGPLFIDANFIAPGVEAMSGAVRFNPQKGRLQLKGSDFGTKKDSGYSAFFTIIGAQHIKASPALELSGRKSHGQSVGLAPIRQDSDDLNFLHRSELPAGRGNQDEQRVGTR